MTTDRDVELEPTGDNIIRTRNVDANFNLNGLGDEYYNLMKKHGNKIAQIDGVTGRTQTYAELLLRCVRAAQAMREYGIKPGDVISLCTHNHLDSCVPLIAALFIGAHVSSIDIAVPEQAMHELFNKIQPKIIFSSKEAEATITDRLRISSIQCHVIVFGTTDKNESFEDFLDRACRITNFEVYKTRCLSETAFICLTGGTSGTYKLAALTHFSMLNFARQYQYITEDTAVILSYSGLIWITGLYTVCAAITYGYTRLILPNFNPAEFFRIIDKYQVNSVMLAGIMVPQILKVPIPDNYNLSSLKSLQFVGSTVSKSCLQTLQCTLPNVDISSGCGQTEAGGFLTYCNWRKDKVLLQNNPGTIGRPFKGCNYKIVDITTGEALGPYKSGELLIKSKLQMTGYCNMDSSHLFDSNGWMKTGDLMYYDNDHLFFFVDRIKEMMKYRSWYISPAYLEGILLQHPSVKLAFVTGVPDDEDGDRPIGAVVLNESCGNITCDELVEYVNKRVDNTHQLRGGVVILGIDAVPFTPAGKLKRYAFKQIVLAEQKKNMRII